MTNYLRLLQYVRPYMKRMLVAMLCIILASAANLYVPWILRDIIDKVLTNNDMSMLNTIAIGIVVVYFLRGVFFYGQTYLMSYIGQKVIMDIRADVYRHLQKLSLSYYEQRQTGEIMSYITNDVAAVQGALVASVTEMVTEGVTFIASLAAMFYFDWQLTLLVLVTAPLVGQAMNIFGKKLTTSSTVIQERAADITSILQETISSVRVIKSFVREEYEVNRFTTENHQNFRAQMKNSQIMAILTPTVEFLGAIGVTLIIWYGGREVINNTLTAGSLIAFLTYTINLTNPIKRLSRVYGDIQKAMAAAVRVFKVLDEIPEIEDVPDAQELGKIDGHVAFNHLTFEYTSGEAALENLELSVKPGQVVAIVGPSGAGKTTIANLIPRFYDPVSGNITIDGIDITTVTLSSLREQIGIVPQETVLFNGSIYNNILYGKLDATEEQVVEAAKAANAHRFILDMPNGYETQIGERGSRLSGGQRQRIAIARAILKDPRILILDEATSALDSESEQLVQEAIDKLMVGRTSFVIAHRLSTIKRANIIVVMERGRLVEQGTHDELLALGGLYSKLYRVQFRKQ